MLKPLHHTNPDQTGASSRTWVGLLLLIVCALIVGCEEVAPEKVEWVDEGGVRWAALPTEGLGQAGFESLESDRTGIRFSNEISPELARENRTFLNGSGVAVGDVDGDGRVDIYFARLNGTNELYLNRGNFRFVEEADSAGVSHDGYHSTGATFADVDGDRDLDLLVTAMTKGNVLYLNDGRGRFEHKANSGLGRESRGATTPTLADINGDGLLDLYVANYKASSARDRYSAQDLVLEKTVEMVDGELRVVPPFDQDYGIIKTAVRSYRNEYGTTDELYLNKGGGEFELADPMAHFFDPDGAPIGLERDWGLTAMFSDVTGDGHPDLYVANDFWTPDRFWINQGDGTFRAADTLSVRSLSYSSMGVDFSDINRDGHVDFVVSEMLSQKHQRRMRQLSEEFESYQGRRQYNRNSLYLNRGDQTFAQIADYSGLDASEWSWATHFTDVDLDGYEDLIFTTGFMNDHMDLDTQYEMGVLDGRGAEGGDLLAYPMLELPNKVFQNNGDLTFTDKSTQWGFEDVDLSNGMALADLNNDGFQDLVINRINKPAAVYRNRGAASRIAVRLSGEAPNTQGIGAVVSLQSADLTQSEEIAAGGRYLSGAEAQATFATPGEGPYTLSVKWPDGRISHLDDAKPDRIYDIDQSAASGPVNPEEAPAPMTPLFEDVSDRIDLDHHENAYNDFRFHPLMPAGLSRLGPGVGWFDFDLDGDDDLLVTTGKGGTLAIRENRGGGRFAAVQKPGITGEADGDQTSLLGWHQDGRAVVVVGSANYEQGNPSVSSGYVHIIGRTGRVATIGLPGVLSTTGPISAADYSGDGYVDLFVGGRFKPGRYPEAADSRLFKSVDGILQFDEADSAKLSGLGLVTGSVFTDYNGDGTQDLLVSTEWGSLRLFENRAGTFQEVTKAAGLADHLGWWTGVSTGDFNNDGRPDIIATNLGLNSPYEVHPDHPLRMYYNVSGDGRGSSIVEAHYDEAAQAYVPRRKMLDFSSIPEIRNRMASHRVFAEATVGSAFGIYDRTPHLAINTLEHMLFINSEDGFDAQPLPEEAQFARAFHPVIADFDADGNEDVFLTQNMSQLSGGTPDMDAGRGLLLLGDGTSRFETVSGQESGIIVYGEQRGAAAADFDGDGRVDLAVSQNGGTTRLFSNTGSVQGVMVKLIGPASNRSAVGSSIRWDYSNGVAAPLREIKAGEGYGSQNSLAQVLGTNGIPDALEVQWFDGKTSSIKFVEGKTEYTVQYPEP